MFKLTLEFGFLDILFKTLLDNVEAPNAGIGRLAKVLPVFAIATEAARREQLRRRHFLLTLVQLLPAPKVVEEFLDLGIAILVVSLFWVQWLDFIQLLAKMLRIVAEFEGMIHEGGVVDECPDVGTAAFVLRPSIEDFNVLASVGDENPVE